MRYFMMLLLAVLMTIAVPFTAFSEEILLQICLFDKDKDGIKNKDDNCPTEPEDIDHFQDHDGCPDYDNDNDKVLDVNDKCKREPEDIDGFEDNDGCPDPDNDKDGIPDKKDQCPNKAEDMDGFQDPDGCPDIDNDNDGILDAADKCPNTAEDKDNFKDEDGCPDLDNDQDGIQDVADKCPDQQENMNGINDHDGCPDDMVPMLPMGKLLLQSVRFMERTTELEPASYKMLDSIAKSMKTYPQMELEIVGHTDKSQNPDEDFDLAQEMALRVMQYWRDKGVGEERMSVTSKGSSRPIASNVTPDGRASNRRIEIIRTR